VARVAAHMRELSAVRDFLLRRKLRWQPAENPEQHYRAEMLEFLAGSKRTFKNSPIVLKGLDRYERVVEGLLRDK
jgi:hypothetical protein